MKHIRHLLISALLIVMPIAPAASLASPASAQGLQSIYSDVAPTFNTADPASSGYALIFADDFHSLSTIDVNATGKPGYKWYTGHFWGEKKATPANCLSVHNGVLTIEGPNPSNGNDAIETAGPASNADGYIGTVFGGASYFEASIAFDNASIDTKLGWPSFWSLDIAHMAPKGNDQWEAQEPGYKRFIEIDFFEDDTFGWAGPNTYGGAVHDTYGKWAPGKGFSTVNNDNFEIAAPHNTDFSKFHRYGCLVVPATKSNCWCGFIQYYFDGLPTSDIVTWTGNKGPGTPPPSGDQTSGDQKYESADKAHLNIILGCGKGQKMRVKYVHVWQLPALAIN